MTQWDQNELEAYPLTGRFLANRVRAELTAEEKRVLETSVDEVEVFDRTRRILTQGEVYNHSTILIDGLVMRTIEGADRRHGISIQVPGDFVDLHCFALKRLDHNLDTVGPVRLGYVRHSRLREIMDHYPKLARILWFATLVDAAIHREWVMKLEQLTVPKRLAHVFAENWYRLRLVGLGDENGFASPLNQAVLSELVGATPIHVSRALKDLRERGIADFSRGRIDLPDREKLYEFAAFDPDYLYGTKGFDPGSENG